MLMFSICELCFTLTSESQSKLRLKDIAILLGLFTISPFIGFFKVKEFGIIFDLSSVAFS